MAARAGTLGGSRELVGLQTVTQDAQAAKPSPAHSGTEGLGAEARSSSQIPLAVEGAAVVASRLRPLAPQTRWLRVELTAYSASAEEGTAAGITYTGVRAGPGTVAVDPTVIPLGSRLRIAGLPGVYRAEDTGGGIRGAHVDVFMASRTAALEFGRHHAVSIEVLAES